MIFPRPAPLVEQVLQTKQKSSRLGFLVSQKKVKSFKGEARASSPLRPALASSTLRSSW